MKYFITGHTGFVGNNFLCQLQPKDEIILHQKSNSFELETCDVVLHFAGKAHDLKNSSNPQLYYDVNTELTKKLFDSFIESKSKVFINISSVKAVADVIDSELTEDYLPSPTTHYGKSKLLADQYILSQIVPKGKRVYILRPCMIYGPNNKGNLNLLAKTLNKGLPWPLGAFENRRSFCSIDNLFFVINELIKNENIQSGVYNIADDEPVSINQLIKIIGISQNRKIIIFKIPQNIIFLLARVGDFFKLPFNTERLNKLTESYVVSNKKIKKAISKSLPVTSNVGLVKSLINVNTKII
jgi:nucleoside-diphosphate-sugar epimerase